MQFLLAIFALVSTAAAYPFFWSEPTYAPYPTGTGAAPVPSGTIIPNPTGTSPPIITGTATGACPTGTGYAQATRSVAWAWPNMAPHAPIFD
jgi:hypothetical protein